MKKSFAIISLTMVLLSGATQADIPLLSFQPGQFSVTFQSNLSVANQTATYCEVSGNDMGAIIFALLSSVNISGNSDVLKLTAIFSGNATSAFDICLFDSNKNECDYKSLFSAFTPGSALPETITLSLDPTGVHDSQFDPTSIAKISLVTSGGGSGSVDLKLYTLTAVPEPTTYALFGAGALALFASGRSRFKAKASLH